jgi:hypothetical protein
MESEGEQVKGKGRREKGKPSRETINVRRKGEGVCRCIRAKERRASRSSTPFFLSRDVASGAVRGWKKGRNQVERRIVEGSGTRRPFEEGERNGQGRGD